MSRFVLGMTLVCVAWMVLGMTEFNESYVFANPGIVAAKAANVAQWNEVVAQQHAAMSDCLSPFKYGMATLLTFIFPPICMLLWPKAAGAHKGINAALSLLLLADLINMMQCNGNNSANGGYDGAGEMICYGLHGLFGFGCCMLFLTRLLWLAASRRASTD